MSKKIITHKEIREYLGHNGAECKVVIHRDGQVFRHGSTEATDRSKDYWSYMGQVDEIKRDMKA